MIYIVTGNHFRAHGIEDIVDMFVYVFQRLNISYEVTTNIVPNSNNLLIDEFSNIYFNENLIDTKSEFPSTKIYTVCTEFITKKFGFTTFNFFSFTDIFFVTLCKFLLGNFIKKLFLFIPLLCALTILIIKLFFNLIMVFANYLLNLINVHYLNQDQLELEHNNPLSRFIARYFMIPFKKYYYFELRFRGFMQVYDFIDHFYLIHSNNTSELIDRKLKGIVYPEIINIDLLLNSLRDKAPGIGMSGSVTSYRLRSLDKFKRTLFIKGIHNFFIHNIVFNKFSPTKKSLKKDPLTNVAFHFHPPQTSGWTFSSPTRIYRTVSVYNAIPIVSKKFNQHPIEDLAYDYTEPGVLKALYNFKSEKNLNDFKTKILKYNKLAYTNNDLIFKNDL